MRVPSALNATAYDLGAVTADISDNSAYANVFVALWTSMTEGDVPVDGLEWLNADSAFGYRASRRIETVRSPFQTVEVFDTPQFGQRADQRCNRFGQHLTTLHIGNVLALLLAEAHQAPALLRDEPGRQARAPAIVPVRT